MKYAKKKRMNPMTGEVETLLVEGDVEGRPWAVVENTPGWLVLGQRQKRLAGRRLRIRLTDIGLSGYLAYLASAGFDQMYSEFSGLKSPDGQPYKAKIYTSDGPLWDETPEGAGDMYFELDPDRFPADAYEKTARDLLDASADLLVKMAALG